MNPIESQLIHAYRTEEKIYGRVFQAVQEQNQLMDTYRGPAAIMEKAREIEELMGRIGEVEQAIAPAKQAWLAAQKPRSEQLDSVLGRIQTLIEATSDIQRKVRDKLLEVIRGRQVDTSGARAKVLAGKARAAYGG